MIALAVVATLLVAPMVVLSAPPPGKGPSNRVRGKYEVRIAGYYSGSGQAQATGAGIKLSATVKDPQGKEYTLDAKQLTVEKDRFYGTGTLSGKDVEIDGRLDAQDKRRGEVLKRGRITFTFSDANGHFGRGAGDQTESGGGKS